MHTYIYVSIRYPSKRMTIFVLFFVFRRRSSNRSVSATKPVILYPLIINPTPPPQKNGKHKSAEG